MFSATARRIAQWLFSGPPRLPSGAYLSWVAEDGSGFLYPEAAALVVRSALYHHRRVDAGLDLERLVPTLEFLNHAVRDGLVWQNGTGYLFDSLLTLAAFLDARAAGIPGPYQARIPELLTATARLAARGRAAVTPHEERWSTRFSPHLLKPLALVLAAEPAQSPAACRQLQAAAHRLLLLQRDNGAFWPAEAAEPVYLHSHCYALEGLAILGPHRLPDGQQAFARGLEFLMKGLTDDGFLPHHPGGTERTCDATAQTGRLALLAGPEHRALALALGERLARLVRPSGAVPYRPDSRHENVWCSAFTLQLLHHLSGAPCPPRELI